MVLIQGDEFGAIAATECEVCGVGHAAACADAGFGADAAQGVSGGEATGEHLGGRQGLLAAGAGGGVHGLFELAAGAEYDGAHGYIPLA